MTINVFEGARTFQQAARVLAMLSLMASMNARGAPINTGVEQLLWPAVVIASPFLLVHELLFGSDSSAISSADREANEILDAYKEQIPVSGLHTGSVNLYGMLVESRLPFIEIDIAGSVWLLSLAKAPQPLIYQAQRHKYIRLSLGKQEDPNCLTWQSTIDDWTTGPPVRPGTCILAVFDNELQSNLQLNVDASRVSGRKLRWELIDRVTGKVHLSVPFWKARPRASRCE